MDKLESQFQKAAAEAKNLPRRPDNDSMLRLYALYKQATQGDATGSRPGFTDPVGRAKFDAWQKLHGQSSEAAMQAYVDLVEYMKGQ